MKKFELLMEEVIEEGKVGDFFKKVKEKGMKTLGDIDDALEKFKSGAVKKMDNVEDMLFFLKSVVGMKKKLEAEMTEDEKKELNILLGQIKRLNKEYKNTDSPEQKEKTMDKAVEIGFKISEVRMRSIEAVGGKSYEDDVNRKQQRQTKRNLKSADKAKKKSDKAYKKQEDEL